MTTEHFPQDPPSYTHALHQALDRVGLRPGMRVLDVGCGTGAHLGALLRRVMPEGSVAGIDVDTAELAIAERRLATEITSGRIALHVADAADLPFPDESFDLAWSSAVFHHIRDPVTALREIARVIRPSGRIALFDGDLGGSFPLLPWPSLLEDRVREASWRAARENYGDTLPYAYDPFFGRRMLGHLHAAGLTSLRYDVVPEVIHAPLDAVTTGQVREWFTGWIDGRIRPYLTDVDHAELHRLMDGANLDNLLADPGFVLLRTWLLASATRGDG